MQLFICVIQGNTKACSKFAFAYISKRLVWKSNTESDIVKLEEQTTLSQKLNENDFNL